MFAITNGVKWQDYDIVNHDEYDTAREARYGMKLYLAHDAGFVLGLAFARHECDALDELVDAGRLDRFQVAADEHPPESEEWNEYACLGNASEFFDLESLGLFEVAVPKMSVAALYNAAAADADLRELCKSFGLDPATPAEILADRIHDDGREGTAAVVRKMFSSH